MTQNTICINLPSANNDQTFLSNGYKKQDETSRKIMIPGIIHFTDTLTEISFIKFDQAKFILTPKNGEHEKSSAMICNFISDEYILNTSLSVGLEINEDEVLAVIPELELYGEGSTEIEALDDLENEMIELYKYLTSIPDENLGKSPKKWKKIITSMIHKKSDN